MNAKYVKLVSRLIEITKDGRLEWRRSSSENQYILELDSASFTITESMSMNTLTAYTLIMYNDKNIEITIASGDTLVNQEDFQKLKTLYEAAIESCLKENATLKRVMEELERISLPF